MSRCWIASRMTAPRARGRPYCLLSRARRRDSSAERTTWFGLEDEPEPVGARPARTRLANPRRQAETLA